MERTDPGVGERAPAVARAVVFLSHSGVDGGAARQLKRLLEESVAGREAGLRVWLDVEGGLLPGAVGWQAQIEEAIDKTSTAFAVYVGSRGVVNWVDNEVRLGLSRATRDKIPFIPILAKETPSAALLPFARQYQAVRDPLNDAGELAKLITAVLQTGEAPRIVENPFVGLRAMTEEDALLFFGRDKELKELEGKLTKSRFVAVVADSGSGKSSLVRAGLIPHYRGGVFADRRSREPDGRIWHVVVMRPGTSPIDGLRMAVTTAAEDRGLSFSDKIALSNAIDFDKAPQTALALQCNLPAATTETLLVVDQFEELFTQTPLPQRQPFIDWLLSLVTPGAQPSFRVVLTMRSDHFNLCQSHAELFARVNRDDAMLRLKPISSGGLADIVREPLRLAGRTNQGEQAALIKQIRQQVSDRAGDLALVQIALYEAWNRRKQHDDDLVESFITVGGVAGALANAAEEVRTGKLDETEQQLLEAVLVRLVVLGEAAGATRRTASLDEFGPPGSPKRLLIDKLADDEHGRLLLTGSDTVEICHEQLVTQWPWWQTWINVHALDMRRLARLMAKARDWFEAPLEEQPTYLATGADLQIFSTLAATNPDWLSEMEQTFVAESQKQQEDWDRQDEEARERERRLRKEAEGNAMQALANAARAEANEAKAEANAAESRANAEKAEGNARKARLRQQWAITMSLLLVLFAVGMALLAQQALESERAAQSEAWFAKRNESAALAALSDLALRDGRPVDAAKVSLAAWPRATTGNDPQIRTALPVAPSQLKERVRINAGSSVLSVAFSSDGTRLAAGCGDHAVRLWDAMTGQEIARFEGEVTRVAFSPDGKHVATASSDLAGGSGDNTARLWDAATGREIAHFEGHWGEVISVAFSPDGTRLATGSNDGTTRLWEVATGKEIARFENDGRVTAVAFSSDGMRVATGSYDYHTASLWDVTTGKEIARFEGHEGSVNSVALSPDGKLLATGAGSEQYNHVTDQMEAVDATTRLWDVATGKEIARLQGDQSPVNSVAFSPDGTRLATGSQDATTRLWDVVTGKEIDRLQGHQSPVNSVAFSPDGTRVATGSEDATARLWDVAAAKEIARFDKDLGPIASVAFSPDGTHLATGSEGDAVELWDVASGREVGRFAGASLAFSPDGKRLVTGARENFGDPKTWLWDVATGEEIATIDTYQVTSLALSSDGRRLATGSQYGMAHVWDVATGKEIGRFKGHEPESSVTSVAWSRDGKHLVTGSLDSTARLWDVATGKENTVFNGHRNAVTSVAFSPNGRHLVTGSWDTTARLWDVATGNEIALLMGHRGTVTSVAFTPDGTRLATGSEDGTARLWDVTTGKEITRVWVPGKAIFSVAFSPDGMRLATGSYGTTRLWDLSEIPSGNAFAIVCAWLPIVDGVGDLSLTEALVGIELEISNPICGPGYDPPVPWWMTPGGTEPQPPGEAQ